jgi:hypothetical protein
VLFHQPLVHPQQQLPLDAAADGEQGQALQATDQ